MGEGAPLVYDRLWYLNTVDTFPRYSSGDGLQGASEGIKNGHVHCLTPNPHSNADEDRFACSWSVSLNHRNKDHDGAPTESLDHKAKI